jgi:hypothetical protein
MPQLAKFDIQVRSLFYIPTLRTYKSGLASNPLYHVSTKYLDRNYGGALYFTMKSLNELDTAIFDKFKLVSRSGRYMNSA